MREVLEERRVINTLDSNRDDRTLSGDRCYVLVKRVY